MSKVIDQIREGVWSPTSDKPMPGSTKPDKEMLEIAKKAMETPDETVSSVKTPTETVPAINMPEQTAPVKELPKDYDEKNSVIIDDEVYTIKPTRLRYFRNKSMSIYHYLLQIPLTEFLTYDKGVFDTERSADQLLFDFLVGVFDNIEIVKNIYDKMTAEHLDKVLEIVGRLDGIAQRDEEAERKNREAAAKR